MNKKKGHSQRTRFHNPTFPLAINNMTKKKKTSSSAKKKSGGSSRRNPTPNVANPKKKTTKRRRRNGVAPVSNPSLRGAVALVTTAVSVGIVNTAINIVTAFLPIPASGWLRTLSKFGIAYGASLLLPRTKLVTQQTADVVALVIASTAVMEVVAPYFSGFVERLLLPTQAVAPQEMAGLVEWAGPYAMVEAGDSEMSGIVEIPEDSQLAQMMRANAWA